MLIMFTTHVGQPAWTDCCRLSSMRGRVTLSARVTICHVNAARWGQGNLPGRGHVPVTLTTTSSNFGLGSQGQMIYIEIKSSSLEYHPAQHKKSFLSTYLGVLSEGALNPLIVPQVVSRPKQGKLSHSVKIQKLG